MNETGGEIHLVLPDATERAACFRALAAGAGRVVRSFASGDAWVEADGTAAGGVLLFAWVQPGRTNGPALLHGAAAHGAMVPLVAAARIDLAEARALLRGGAHDLLPAPLDPRAVRRAVDAAFASWRARQAERASVEAAADRLAALTPRERDILEAIAAGLGNKAIARQLDLSPRTVEVHRASIMRRAGAATVAELLHLRFVAASGCGGVRA